MATVKYTKANYNPNRGVILSNEIIENCRYSLSTNGFILLMGLSQTIDYTQEIWPEFELDIKGLFKFFNISETNGKRYDVVRESFENILDNPLKIRISNKNWSGIPWLSYEYNEAISNRVKVSFHDKAIPYLFAFKETISIHNKAIGYTKILPKHYVKFKSDYTTWFYPFFMKWRNANEGTAVIVKKEIKWIREKSFTEKTHAAIGDLISKVVNKAIKEINLLTNIHVKEITRSNNNMKAEIKGSRQISHVYFIISTADLNKQEVKDPETDKKTNKYLDQLYSKYNSVEPLSQEIIFSIRSSHGGFDSYADQHNSSIVQIGDDFYLCK